MESPPSWVLDELFKSSAYLTEACLRNDSSRPPFGHAFDTDVEFFPWLEGEGGEDGSRIVNKDKLRVERFGKAMSGSGSWEAPGAIFEGFDWRSLPRGSTIVDVGGGIGSSSMMLANAYCQPNGGKSMDSLLHAFLESPGQQREESDEDFGFKFIIQDRPIVVEMGEKAWRAKCPELLDSGIATFQEHDFFTEQPIRNAAVFFLRVILHDWPDSSARAILLRLREAAKPETKLVLAEFVLPLACVDADEVAADDPAVTGVLNGVEGAESTLAPAPLLANLGKASANAYWMDLTMQVTFNAQERTLRETTALAQSAGWKVVKVTRSPGSLFGHIVAVPAPIPPQYRTTPDLSPTVSNTSLPIKVTRSHNPPSNRSKADFYDLERTRSESRCGTPTFGSRTALPSMQESMRRFGGSNLRSRVPGLSSKPRLSSTRATGQSASSSTGSSLGQSNQNPSNSPVHVKKKPSPLALVTSKSNITSPLPSPRLASPQPAMKRRFSLAQLRSLPPKQAPGSPAPIMRDHETPPSPITPKYPSFTTQSSLPRRASNAQLTLTHIPTRSLTGVIPPSPLSPLLPPLPSATSPLPSESRSIPTSPSPRKLSRPKSLAHLYQSAQSQESGSKPPTPVPPVPPLRPSALSPSTSTSHSPYDPPPRVPPPRLGPIPRRASQAPAPQSNSLRKRSGTVISPPLGAGVGVGGAVSMISNLLQPDAVRGSGGGSLNFGDVSNGKMKEKERSDAEPNDLGKMMTLAAAAHIE
ncbi:hypothetical protein H0H93_000213 [Arthromyces matolae]|nr:hypothetical protein H0H93_000213 [Arthromyces matolae]